MQEVEKSLTWIHPGRMSGALIYLGLIILIGIVGSLAIRGVARRALRLDKVDHMAVAFMRPVAQIILWGTLGVMYLHLIPVLRAVGNAIAGLALLVTRCPVVDLGNSSVTLRVRAWCHDPLAAHRMEYDLLERAMLQFREAGIEIPHPYQNFILESQ